MSETFTGKDVAEHNTVDNGLYIIIDSNVYSMASFVDEHPGGSKILKRVGGKDATKQFWKVRIPDDALLRCVMAGILDDRMPWREASL
jgi:cytochrome b involved in lipid metabolism